MKQPGKFAVPADLPCFRQILVVTDFSATSASAASFGALLAGYYRASVVVAHVFPPVTAEASAGAQRRNADHTIEEQLEMFVTRSALGEYAPEIVVRQGSVWEELADLVQKRGIDLVVLGTQGRSGVGKLLLGSVAQRIFTLAPCPVMTVSPRARRLSPGYRITRILYATNFTPESLEALPYALSLARTAEAELVLLHAPETEPASSEVTLGYQQHLAALIPPQHAAWCKFDTLVTAGDPARAIVDAAARNSADLVVIGAKTYEGSLAHFQVPLSIAYRVVAHAPCPVLRIRSTAETPRAV